MLFNLVIDNFFEFYKLGNFLTFNLVIDNFFDFF